MYGKINTESQPYTMYLNKMEPTISRIGINQQVRQDKYQIKYRRQDLRGNLLRGKTTSSDEQTIHYEDEEYKWWEPTRLARLLNPNKFHFLVVDL